MQIVEKALDEVKKVLILLEFSGRFLDFLLIFTFFLLLGNIFNFNWFYALLPGLVYLTFMFIFSFFKNHYLAVENKVPELNEQLRTVADNLYRSNPILDSLKEDVVKNMKKVKTSYFINEKVIGVKILILCGLAFAIVFASFMNINVDFSGLNFDVPDPLKAIGIRGYGQEPVKLDFFLSQGNLSDILGNKSLTELGSKEFLINIKPLESDADLGVFGKEQDNEFNKPNFPKEIYTRYDVSYNEEIAKENRKVVKSYFDQIIR